MPATSSSASSSVDMGPDGSGGPCREDRGRRTGGPDGPRPRSPRPRSGDDWVALVAEPLPVATAVRVGGPARLRRHGHLHRHGPRPRRRAGPGVHRLEYEAYEEPGRAPPARRSPPRPAPAGPTLGRVALLHRTGVVELGEAAVVVAVSAPHRAEAFEAARFAIDELKRTVPIWKREAWDGGESWGLEAQHLTEVPGRTS